MGNSYELDLNVLLSNGTSRGLEWSPEKIPKFMSSNPEVIGTTL